MATCRQVRLVKPNWSSGPKSVGGKSDPEREVLKEAEGHGRRRSRERKNMQP